MSRHAQWETVAITPEKILLRDLGPHDQFLTITNDAEHVVETLAPTIGNRRLLYYDSDNALTEIVIRDGQFSGFAFPKYSP
jgi:hypothetical protein